MESPKDKRSLHIMGCNLLKTIIHKQKVSVTLPPFLSYPPGFLSINQINYPKQVVISPYKINYLFCGARINTVLHIYQILTVVYQKNQWDMNIQHIITGRYKLSTLFSCLAKNRATGTEPNKVYKFDSEGKIYGVYYNTSQENQLINWWLLPF